MLDWITSQSVQVPPAPTLLVALLPSRWRVSEREVAAVGIETPTEANQKRTNQFCTGWKLVHNSYHLYVKSKTISNQVTVQRNSLRVLRPSTYGGSCGQGLQHICTLWWISAKKAEINGGQRWIQQELKDNAGQALKNGIDLSLFSSFCCWVCSRTYTQIHLHSTCQNTSLL